MVRQQIHSKQSSTTGQSTPPPTPSPPSIQSTPSMAKSSLSRSQLSLRVPGNTKSSIVASPAAQTATNETVDIIADNKRIYTSSKLNYISAIMTKMSYYHSATAKSITGGVSGGNYFKNCLASIVIFAVVLQKIDLCDSKLTVSRTDTNKSSVVSPFIELVNNRFIRSYSEEFMTSSEERERGLQFFGGSSAGSSSSSKHRIAPYFDTESLSTNVTISEGSAFVHLPCRVKQLGERTLSWIRRQDLQILTVGKFTYTSDQRFQAVHLDNSDDWSLQISYPQKKDAGIYECQVATMPKMSLFTQLNVVVSKAKIVEGPTLYLSSGSTLNLTCVVRDTPEPPDYIFWYYNGQVINYGSPRGIKVHTEKSAQTISKLVILKAQPNDSGNYSCTPSNAEPAHIAVHVHNNANPAASIQHGKRSAREFGNNSALSTGNDPTKLAIMLTCLSIMLNTIYYYYEPEIHISRYSLFAS